MRFEELIRVCHTSDTNIKNIFIEAETTEAKRLMVSGPDSIVLSGISIPLQQAGEDENFTDMEVLGISIKDDSTLKVSI